MRYVKDPLFFDLFNIFTGNRTASSATCRTPGLTHIPSNSEDMQENVLPSACHGHRIGVPSQVLYQELVLRNRPFHRHRRVLLRRCEG